MEPRLASELPKSLVVLPRIAALLSSKIKQHPMRITHRGNLFKRPFKSKLKRRRKSLLQSKTMVALSD